MSRTIEAIKGKRKAASYRQLVAKLLEECTSAQNTGSLESVEGTSQDMGLRGLVEDESRVAIDRQTSPKCAVEVDVSVSDDPDRTLIWGTVEYYLGKFGSFITS